MRHNLTLICLEDLMKLLNEDRGQWDKLPTTKKLIIKLFRQNRDVFDVFYLVKCDKCKATTRIDSQSSKSKCERCDNVLKKRETNFFVSIPVEQQIKKSIEGNKEFVMDSNNENSCYSDAYDGLILKKILAEYKDTDVNILSLCINLDGANKFKSNFLSVWPIQLIQNYLPPSIRFLPNNIITTGLFYDKNKPDCYDYMMPLINELNDLYSRKMTITIEGTKYNFMPVITHCAVDLPAKSMLQQTKQYGSYDGCTYCDIPGEQVTIEIQNNSDDEETSNTKKKHKKKSTKKVQGPKKFVRYVEGGEVYNLRNEKETLETMLAVSQTGEAVDGIKGKKL